MTQGNVEIVKQEVIDQGQTVPGFIDQEVKQDIRKQYGGTASVSDSPTKAYVILGTDQSSVNRLSKQTASLQNLQG